MEKSLNSMYLNTLREKEELIKTLWADNANLRAQLAHCSIDDNAKNAEPCSNIHINLNEKFQVLVSGGINGKINSGIHVGIGLNPYQNTQKNENDKKKHKNNGKKKQNHNEINPLTTHPYNVNHQKMVTIENEKYINYHVELEWEVPLCLQKKHHDPNDKHIGEPGSKKDCKIQYHSTFASGTLIATKPYFVILAAAHSFIQYGARNYRIHWCPIGQYAFRIPIHFVKKHPKYDEKTINAAYDIAIAVGNPYIYDKFIKQEIDKFRMKPFQLTIGPMIQNKQSVFFLKGFTPLINGKSSLFQSDLLKKLHSTSETIKFEGGVVFGQSGGAIIQCTKYRGESINVIGIQSIGSGVLTQYPQDFHHLTMCRISADKINFLKEFAPCQMIIYESNGNQCITVYDSK